LGPEDGALYFFEISVEYDQTTQHYIPEDRNIQEQLHFTSTYNLFIFQHIPDRGE
jgi:hypothetical protein